MPQRKQKHGCEESSLSPHPHLHTLQLPPSLSVAPPQLVTHLFPKFMAFQGHTDSIISTFNPSPTLKGFLTPELRGESFFCRSLQYPAQVLGQSGPS